MMLVLKMVCITVIMCVSKSLDLYCYCMYAICEYCVVMLCGPIGRVLTPLLVHTTQLMPVLDREPRSGLCEENLDREPRSGLCEENLDRRGMFRPIVCLLCDGWFMITCSLYDNYKYLSSYVL